MNESNAVIALIILAAIFFGSAIWVFQRSRQPTQKRDRCNSASDGSPWWFGGGDSGCDGGGGGGE